MEGDKEFENFIRDAYEAVYDNINKNIDSIKLKNTGDLVLVIRIMFEKSNALEIHFVTNKKLYGIFLGKIKSRDLKEWEIPPEKLPLNSTKNAGGNNVMVRFLENDDIFNRTVYMIQYRIENFSERKKQMDRLEFSVIDENLNNIEGGTHNNRITFTNIYP